MKVYEEVYRHLLEHHSNPSNFFSRTFLGVGTKYWLSAAARCSLMIITKPPKEEKKQSGTICHQQQQRTVLIGNFFSVFNPNFSFWYDDTARPLELATAPKVLQSQSLRSCWLNSTIILANIWAQAPYFD